MFACIHSPNAGEIAGSFSPWVEMADERTALFSITARQLAEDRLQHLDHAAVAETTEAAILAARHLPGFTLIQPGDEQRVLGALPIDALPPDPEIFKTLDAWGIRTLGDFAQLPEKGIAERLGPRGVWLCNLARGALARPLKPHIATATYEESAEFDYALDRLEPLLFLLGQFLFRLMERLDSQSLAAGALALTLNQTERVLRLPFPTRDVKFLLKLLEHDLETHKPGEPIERVHLRIETVEPRRVQHGLFTLAAPEPEKLELTLGKIRGLVGAKNVKTPELRDTYRPGWGQAEIALAFRHFRPPLEAHVQIEAGRPRRLRANGLHGIIVRAAGPWRTSGEWWRADQWDRDEWDILLSRDLLSRDREGAVSELYRLCFRRAAREWFVEGSYD